MCKQYLKVNQFMKQNQKYIYESTARKLRPEVHKRVSRQTKQIKHHKAEGKKMNIKYVLFLTFALCVSSFVLIYYLYIQSEVLNKLKAISRLESELNSIKIENSNKMAAIENNINISDIKIKAIYELGMQYPQEYQIIYYTNEASDYIRQYGNIPQ